MAESTSTVQIVPTSPRGTIHHRGARRGRADSNTTSQGNNFRGSNRGGPFRGGREGRGGRARRNSNNGRFHGPGIGPAPPGDQPPGFGGGGTFGDRLTGDASNTEGQVDGKRIAQVDGAAEDQEVEGEVCFICASRIEHTSIAPCNHQTCHICSLRLRALYKTKACAHCRTEANYVIFTDDPTKRYEDFTENDFIKSDDNLGIKYEKDEIFEDTVLLLRYNCPDKDCDVACLGWPDLHRHVKSKHGKVMCDLCTRKKKVFTHEHELFTLPELRRHEKFGDDNPGAVDQSGFKGHPECGFCRERFYGDDELYTHCRDKHERCHICDRRNSGRQQQYYVNYNALEDHFRKEHFVCLDQECQEKKFVVFESEMDLKAHQLEAHPNGMSKDVRRDARMVDMSSFDYRTPYQPQRQRREGRGGGRGRDPNAEPLPASSAQPLGRAELAYQRQMAIQSAQSISTRTFGGQLTSSDTQTVRAPARPPQSSHSDPNQTQSLPSLEALDIASNTHTTPQDQARRLRHNAVMDRASNLLKNDTSKISSFRTKVSSYQSSTITATNLIDAFFSLFDVSSTELGKLVKELAEIYENETKRNDLLKAWNDWRAINEDYPILPGPSGTLPGLSPSTISSGTSGSSGRRVLRLKSSTAQSSRSAVSRHGSWGNALSTSPFPALGPAPSNSKRAPAWAIGTPPSSRGSPATSRPSSKPPPASRTAAASSEAFPALPTAAKPNTLMAGLTRGSVRWDDRRGYGAGNGGGGVTMANPWGGLNGVSSNTSPAATAAVDAEDSGPAAGAKKKGKGGKKQVLYHFG